MECYQTNGVKRKRKIRTFERIKNNIIHRSRKSKIVKKT